MGNIFCPYYFDADLEDHPEDLTKKLRKQMKMISFKPAKDFNAETLASKLEIVKEYNILCQIGRGLFSQVYLAVDPSGRKVGLKVIRKKNFATKQAIEKIIIEKEVLKMIDHKNVLKLYRTMQTNSHIYFVLEYADKGNLLNIVNTKRLTPAQIRVILAQIIEALFYIHSHGIIYGDLKAENILVNKSGAIKLCDFNLSGTKSLLDDCLQGTPSYIAPEILEGCDRTSKSDFWSLGVLAYLLTYRRMPFRSSTQAELLFDILYKEIENEPPGLKAPKDLRLLIKDLLVKNHRNRIGSEITDFANHPFFEGFDWKEYRQNPINFSYVEGIDSFEELDEPLLNRKSDVDKMSLAHSRNQKFVYNINDFTYQTKESLNTSEISLSHDTDSPRSVKNTIIRASMRSRSK